MKTTMKTKTMLLGSAAGIAIVPAAQAADVAAKAAPVPVATANWSGWYVGGNLGAVWQQGSTSGTGYDDGTFVTPVSSTQSQTGFMGGGQIGYNWQNGNALYGVEADISGLSGKASGFQKIINKGGAGNTTTTNKIDWVATFRGRLGLAVGNAMAYVTAGGAAAGVKNQLTITCGGGNCTTQTWTDDATRWGLAAGVGVSTLITSNWSLRTEALFVDLGKGTGSNPHGNANGVAAQFSNQAVIGRVGVDYHF